MLLIYFLSIFETCLLHKYIILHLLYSMFKKIILILNFYFIKFFGCIVTSEISNYKKRIEYLKYFFNEIDIIKFVILPF